METRGGAGSIDADKIGANPVGANPMIANPMDWANLAKSFGICLIVLYHARLTYRQVGWHDPQAAIGFWNDFVIVIRPIVIPCFFLVSGVLVSASLKREWSAIAAARVWRYLYLFYLWGLIYALAVPRYPLAGSDLAATLSTIANLASVGSNAWYVWATAVFFVLAWITRKLPAWAAVGLGLAVSAILPGIVGYVNHQAYEMMRCLVYFMVGIRMPQVPRAVAARATLPQFAVVLALYAAGVYVIGSRGILYTIPTDILALLLVCCGTGLAARRWPGVAARARWMSDRTLAIYLIHFPLLVILPALAARVLPDAVLASAAAAVAFPLIVGLLAGGLAVLAYGVLMRTGGTWLFDLPQRIPLEQVRAVLSNRKAAPVGQT